jgi:ferritin-like metal-binding protein YciE
METVAKQLGKHEAAALLEQNIKQEKHADELLTKIAESRCPLSARGAEWR